MSNPVDPNDPLSWDLRALHYVNSVANAEYTIKLCLTILIVVPILFFALPIPMLVVGLYMAYREFRKADHWSRLYEQSKDPAERAESVKCLISMLLVLLAFALAFGLCIWFALSQIPEGMCQDWSGNIFPFNYVLMAVLAKIVPHACP